MLNHELNAGATCWASDDWTYETYDLDQPSQAFGPFEQIIRLWRSKRRDALPDWSDFQFMDFEGWWGWISVYDVVDHTPPSFRVRLWGVESVRHLGYDPTGQLLTASDIETSSDAKHVTVTDLQFARHVLDTECIGHAFGPIDAGFGDQQNYWELLLPLRTDNQKTDKVMLVGRVTK